MATLGQMRQALDPERAANIKRIAGLFEKIARTNPDAVKAVFTEYLKRDGDEKTMRMVEFYADMAADLVSTFDYS